MLAKWSERFSEELKLCLPPDVVEWLDGRYRHHPGFDYFGEFTDPIEPEALLDPSSFAVWGGQMLPDTLPLLGNGCGDVLSLRIGADGQVSELIRWAHEVGHWRPYGTTLAESLLCDIGVAQSEGIEDGSQIDASAANTLEQWAVEWVRRTNGPTLEWVSPLEDRAQSALARLARAGVCEVAALRESCSAYLKSRFSKRAYEVGYESIAKNLRLEWSDVTSWLFDSNAVPAEYRAPLGRLLDEPVEELLYQDWG